MFSIALASTMAYDGLEITFLCSNKTKEDMLLANQLDNLTKINSKLKVFHTLTRHNEETDGMWGGYTGRVSLEMFQKCGFPEPAHDTLIAICGPKNFKENIIKDILEPLGYIREEMTN